MAASEVPDAPGPLPTVSVPSGTSPAAAPRGGLRTPPLPVAVDARRIVGIGTAIWFAAFLILLPFYSRLRADDHLLWLWTCLCGTILGLLGLVLIRKHRGEGRAT